MKQAVTFAWAGSFLLSFSVACGGGSNEGDEPDAGGEPDGAVEDSLNEMVRSEAEAQGLQGYPELETPQLDAEEQAIIDKRAELGRLLFFDRALSGPEHTTCASCHHPAFAFGDGRAVARGVYCVPNEDGTAPCEDLPAPENGDVVGPDRTAPLNERNSPSVLNAPLFPRQMANGRFHFVDESSTDVNELDPSMGFNVQNPEGVLFTRSLLGAQAFKPVPSVVEMAGDFPFEGEVLPGAEVRADAVRDGIAQRITDIAEYHTLFEEAYPVGQPVFEGDPEIGPGDPIPYTAIADAMAHWQERDLIMTDAPWDAFLAGDDTAISQSAKRGALIFLTRGECSSCHAGDLFTDFDNYNIGVPQVGPGTGRGDPEDPAYEDLTTWDFGLEQVTGERGDRFKFRTPPLRGITLTPPYMHNGAYPTLEEAILHHTDPRAHYDAYDIEKVEPDMQAAEGLKPADPVFDEANPVPLGPGTDMEIQLSDGDVEDLIEFMKTLTDPRMLDVDELAPDTLPSGLPPDAVGEAAFETYQ